MASYRRLPSGLWQASVRLPSGKRITQSDKLKAKVKTWATDMEAEIAKGKKIDPRAGRITVQEWHARWWAARVVEDSTRRTNESQLRLHVLPHWREWRLGEIGRIDVQAWVRQMEQDGVGPHAIKHSYKLLVAMLGDAVIEGLIPVSPCQRISLPPTPPKPPAWFTRAQLDLLVAELPAGHGVMTELMARVGLRWGEAAAVVGADRPDEVGNPVDWLRGRILIRGSLTQHGKWKPYPKNSKSRAEVPVEREVLDLMAPLLEGRPADAWVFVNRRRSRRSAVPGPVSGATWRETWYKAIDAANKAAGKRLVPRLDPHDCRHTAASWLVQDGVPLYDVMALLRHASIVTTMRYAHLAPDAHEAVTRAWSRRGAHQERTGPRALPSDGG